MTDAERVVGKSDNVKTNAWTKARTNAGKCGEKEKERGKAAGETRERVSRTNKKKEKSPKKKASEWLSLQISNNQPINKPTKSNQIKVGTSWPTMRRDSLWRSIS